MRLFYLFVHTYHTSECSGLQMGKKRVPHLSSWGKEPLSVTYNLSPLPTLALLHTTCICTTYSLYLGKICCLNFFVFPQERYPWHVPSPAAPLMVKTSFSSENHKESTQIMSLMTSLVTLTMTAISAHLLAQPSTNDYNFGSQHAKGTFHRSMTLRATTERDSSHWIVTSFPTLKNSSSEVSIASNRRDAKTKE